MMEQVQQRRKSTHPADNIIHGDQLELQPMFQWVRLDLLKDQHSAG